MQEVNDQKFYRSGNRILGGVCAGLAEGFHLDALWVRVAFLLLAFLQGVGVFLYVILWLVMPERLEDGNQRSGFDAMSADLRRIWGEIQRQFGSAPVPASSSTAGSATSAAAPAAPASTAQVSPAPQPVHYGWRNPSVLVGMILVIVGLAFLGNNIGIIDWAVVWPAALITLGIVVLVRNIERRP
jgi:phage shock protein PspC (stress-responsive transcriptional regulator)